MTAWRANSVAALFGGSEFQTEQSFLSSHHSWIFIRKKKGAVELEHSVKMGYLLGIVC